MSDTFVIQNIDSNESVHIYMIIYCQGQITVRLIMSEEFLQTTLVDAFIMI